MEFTSTSPPTPEQVTQLKQLLAEAQQQAQRSERAARAALARAEFAESERDGLIDTLENAFGQICIFKRENGMSDNDDITGRWFKQLLQTLRESEQAESSSSSSGGGFGGSALDDVDMLNTSFYSGTALSRSVVEQASSAAQFGNIEPLPISRASHPRPRNSSTRNTTTATATRRNKSPTKPRRKNNGEPKVYKCDICQKNFAGASGLWYHNKHVHGAETQLRPRKPKKKTMGEQQTMSAF